MNPQDVEVVSATLHETRVPEDSRPRGPGFASLEDILVRTGSYQGTVPEIFGKAQGAGADAIRFEPLGHYRRFLRTDDEVTYVRSPTTGNYYEHIYEWDPQPFVRWLNPSCMIDPNFKTIKRETLTVRGGNDRNPLHRVRVGIFFGVLEESHLLGNESRDTHAVRARLHRAVACERRDVVEELIRHGLVERTFGLEASFEDIQEEVERTTRQRSGVLRLERPALSFSETVKIIMCAAGEFRGLFLTFRA